MKSKTEEGMQIEEALKRIYMAIEALSPAYNSLTALAILSPERWHISGFLRNYRQYPDEKLEILGLKVTDRVIVKEGLLMNILKFLAESFALLDNEDIKKIFDEAVEKKVEDPEKVFGRLLVESIINWAVRSGIATGEEEVKQYLKTIVKSLKNDRSRNPDNKFYTLSEVPSAEEIFADLKNTDSKAFRAAEDLFHFLRRIGVIKNINGKDRLLFALLKVFAESHGD